MSDHDKQEYLEFAKQLALDAGDIMRRYFGQSPDHHYKEDETIVTVADEEINRLVIERVNQRYPEHGVNGEEESHVTESQYVWVCDPIDGTNPFAMELPVSVFSLALVVDGKPEIGVIYAPFSEKLYSAVLGGRAFCNDKQIAVTGDRFGIKSRMNVDWGVGADYDVMPIVHKLAYDKRAYVLCPGSTTHAAALVASGEFVASIFPGTKGKNVDIAAAKVIVEEAGGKVTDFFGNEQRYDQDINGAILSNGIVHQTIVDYLKELRR